ncbi:flagellar basal body-associated FliL family protein [Pseudobacteriovorax antillogorgiicola]|uniref:Flagellar protein FliL n=1 Tax=Pseudobacteriovorax antillogorgiicola TaxID=1513793 RepID=A0A1Y6CP38_9BACT|nr:flagellar basal body-associated FliL family protein [Pseudobacteriovorax antillogorgiicola]TCS46664.1 flagellar FliL protein [Pseudobacteriovorax antillogorgiicola]SMF66548.1 flagellar FliL protein [Pseudobacteriovorax antillogorgiicola]
MADEEKDEAPAEAPAEGGGEDDSGGGKKKLLIIAIIALVLVLGGGVGAFFMLSGGDEGQEKEVATEVNEEATADPAPEDGAEEAGDDGEEKAEGEAKEGAPTEGEGAKSAEGTQGQTPAKSEEDLGIDFGDTYQMKTFNLNLGNALENRFVRLEVTLEFSGGEKQKKEITKRLPQLRDAVISVVSRKTREFLLAPDGKDALRKEILIRINRYMKQKIDAVYITDILIE